MHFHQMFQGAWNSVWKLRRNAHNWIETYLYLKFLSRDVCTSQFSLDTDLGPDCSVDTGLLQMKGVTNLQLVASMLMMADLSITACKQKCIGRHNIQLFAHT